MDIIHLASRRDRRLLSGRNVKDESFKFPDASKKRTHPPIFPAEHRFNIIVLITQYVTPREFYVFVLLELRSNRYWFEHIHLYVVECKGPLIFSFISCRSSRFSEKVLRRK